MNFIRMKRSIIFFNWIIKGFLILKMLCSISNVRPMDKKFFFVDVHSDNLTKKTVERVIVS